MMAETDKKTAIVKLEGSLSIERADELKKMLCAGLDGAETLMLDFKEVTKIDLSFLQLLCSLCRTAAGTKTGLKWRGTAPDILQKTVAEAGYNHSRGCFTDRDVLCLWAEVSHGK